MQSINSTAPANLTTGYFLGEGLTLLKRCSRCILKSQPTVPQNTRWVRCYPFAEMQSVYSTAPADCATEHSLGKVLPICRNAVTVFYSTSRLSHESSLGKVLTHLQKCSRCILQLQLIGQSDFRISFNVR